MITRVLSMMEFKNLVILRTLQDPSATVTNFVQSKFNAEIAYEPKQSWPGYAVSISFVSEKELTWFYLHV